MKRSLFWKIFPSFMITAFLGLMAFSLLAVFSFRSFYFDQAAGDLAIRNKLLEAGARLQLSGKGRAEFNSEIHTRVTVIRPDGKVIWDSEREASTMDNHLHRPEVQQSLSVGNGSSIRYSATLQKDFIYSARAIYEDGKLLGFVRSSVAADAINQALGDIYFKIFAGSFALLMAIGIWSYWRSKQLTLPLEEMRKHAGKIAEGDFQSRVMVSAQHPREVAELTQAMNDLTVQLDNRINEILNQKKEQDALFQSLREGVLAFEQNGRLKYLNPRASEILGIRSNDVEGKSVEEVIRIPEIQELVRESIEEAKPIETEVEFYLAGRARYFRVQANPFRGQGGGLLGSVIVLNDLTKIRDLEEHRKEFVANVSHELRTPLTSISGYAETLMKLDVDDPKKKTEFVEIIYRHSTRLGAIVEDLLELSRIEKDGLGSSIQLETAPVKPLIESVARICREKSKKNLPIEIECPDRLVARIDQPLLERALTNLVDNAIKYTEKGAVRIKTEEAKHGFVRLMVEDEGIGIEKHHLPRLFERFYRVDKARSREMGGTGLGLSIVKHVAIAHGGDVGVESEPGRGSKFFIDIPA